MMKSMRYVSQFVRLKDWKGKARGMLLILLLYNLFQPIPIIYYLHALIFSALILSFFFVINDYCDKRVDKIAGKYRPVQDIPLSQTKLILIGLLALSVGYYLMFFRISSFSLLSLTALIILGVLYPAYPIRLKERGIWGLIAPALYERTLLISTIIYGITNSPDLLLLIYFCLTTFLAGVMVMINHQVKDLKNDQKSGVITWVSQRDIKRVNLSYKLLYVPTKLIALLFLPLAMPTELTLSVVVSLIYFIFTFG